MCCRRSSLSCCGDIGNHKHRGSYDDDEDLISPLANAKVGTCKTTSFLFDAPVAVISDTVTKVATFTAEW
jgi:hypothetical protein